MAELQPIPGHTGCYATKSGRIYVTRKGVTVEACYDPNSRGYQRAWVLTDAKERKRKSVHRLVWTAFNGEVPEGYEIDHKNLKRKDNRLVNLRLLTRAENRTIKRRPLSRRNVEYVLYQGGVEKHRIKGISNVAAFLGVSTTSVYHHILGDTNSVSGYQVSEATG
jgi:hypothetical protein